MTMKKKFCDLSLRKIKNICNINKWQSRCSTDLLASWEDNKDVPKCSLIYNGECLAKSLIEQSINTYWIENEQYADEPIIWDIPDIDIEVPDWLEKGED